MCQQASLTNKTVVITGATAGLGLASAVMLCREGARVIGIAREEPRVASALAHIRQMAPDADISFELCDLSRQSQVNELGERLCAMLQPCGLDVLIHNAAAYVSTRHATVDAQEWQWAVNYIAPFLLTYRLLPVLQAAQGARVILVSSRSHRHTRLRWHDLQQRKCYNGLLAYKHTKLAMVMFAHAFNRRHAGGETVRAFVADPGLIQTEIGARRAGGISRAFWNIRKKYGSEPQKPAAMIAYLASSPEVWASEALYYREAQPLQPSRYALRDGLCDRLWAQTLQWCRLQHSGWS